MLDFVFSRFQSDLDVAQTPGSVYYIKECVEFDDIPEMLEDMRKNPVDQVLMTQNLNLLKMAFKQLSENPEQFYKKGTNNQIALDSNILKGTKS